MHLSIILPTYNESQNIVDLVNEIKKTLKDKPLNYEVLIIDDNSPDNTYTLALKKFKKEKNVRVFRRMADHNLGRSILFGIKVSSAEFVLVMDSDFNHDPKMIWTMYCLLDFYDMVVGSRFVYGGGMEDNLRHKFSFLYNLLVRIILGTHIQDNLSGFFITKRKLLMPFAKKEIFVGYGEYFIRLIYRLKIAKYKIIEVPVFYNLRRHGKSKSNFYKMFITYTKTLLTELFWEIRRTKSLKSIFNR